MTRIFVIDDHPVVRQSYALLIRREAELVLCGEAASGREALEKIPLCAPDVVVMDMSLQDDMDGIVLLQQLAAQKANLAVLVVSGHDELIYAQRLIELGARGYVMKGDATAFLQALRQVIHGATYLSEEVRHQHNC
jgi:DNA-binding NarL/FixJ family response regulator